MFHRLAGLRARLGGSLPTADQCVVCGRRLPPFVTVALCRHCYAQMPVIDDSSCRRCGRPVRGATFCQRCQTEPLQYAAKVRAVCCYDGVVQDWLHAIKYGGQWELADTLGALMALRFPEAQLRVDCIVPVPLHVQRLRQRGFNQAELLAHRIARHRLIPCHDQAIGRVVNTSPQSGLSPAERMRNLFGAFSVFEPARIRGKTVLVIDDIYTTGATVNELARVLLRAGAREVNGFCFAVGINDADLEV